MNRKGFTLIEVIISVAVLSVLSVYLVQLFIHAHNLNTKAYELDQTVVMTQNILELVQQQETPLIKGNELYPLNWKKVGADYDAILHFDNDFKVTDKSQSPYELVIKAKELKRGVSHKALYQFYFEMHRQAALPMEKSSDLQIYKMSSIKLLKSWE